ncbi:hypothetical protein I3215_07140 [Streptomyces sp. RB110-1]|uniref:hypothetical protein n=1 Tax=unclassified Streptomyces TaxID=2593676 RepID=UPI00190090ED|nr:MULTISPECIES: hypothetical protein [unclassified Streptomyces]MBK0372672.1 hypothetical protein [Streptomyces sp. RB110-1]MBK0384662.1 hypothetical protein [Streptomyces sp. RB110-2]
MIGEVCSQCRTGIGLPVLVAALWRACREVVKAERRVGGWAQETSHTWLGFARAQVRSAWYRDETVRELLSGPLGDAELAEQAQSVLAAWESVVDEQHAVLSAFRAQCPDPVLSAAVGTACDAVLSQRDVQRTGEGLAQAVRGGWGWNVRPGPLVCRAWSNARLQGSSADEAGQAAFAALESKWGRGVRVTDVSALEAPMLTSSGGHPTPASWADAEFCERWGAFALMCCVRLEEALEQVRPGGDGDVLLLVEGWPLVAAADLDLAFLARWDPVGPGVPTAFGRRRYEEQGSHDDFGRHAGYASSAAVVLSVPAWAAQRAQAGSRHAGRIRIGPRVTGDTLVDRAARLDMLRSVFPLLAEDFESDRPLGEASDLVQEERRRARLLLQARRPFQPGPGDAEQEEDWVRYLAADRSGVLWVPGEDEDTWRSATDLLSVLRGPFGSLVPVALHIETGPCSALGLHTLHGRLVDVDRERGLVVFALGESDRWVFQVPMRRVVAVSRPRELKGRGERPLWQAAAR